MSGIFVSYRRSDSQGEAGRLFDDLVGVFGEQSVFMDVAAIEAGRDFRKAIEKGVTSCGVLLVVMGPEWLNAKNEQGARRLDDPADFVRIETASALKRDIPVIPVLVRGARMPLAEQLPEDLRDLAYRNCVELTHARWKSDAHVLVEALHRVLGETGQAKAAKAAASAESVASSQQAQGASHPPASYTQIDPAVLRRVRAELALYIGQIAEIVVRRAASRCTSVEELYLKVAEEIDSPSEREKFLFQRGVIPTAAPAPVANASPKAKNASGILAPAPLPEKSEPPKLFPASAGMRSSSRSKYLLVAIVGGILMIVMLILGTRSMRSRGTASSPPVPISAPKSPSAEPALTKTTTPSPSAEAPAGNNRPIESPAARAPEKGEPRTSQRVRLLEEVSRDLLIKTAPLAYPPLARQARIQGEVVLQVDVSKDGTIDTVKAISGHPLLIPAAVDAAKQWRYKPYLLKGEPVAINTRITVRFKLSGG